MIVVIANPDTGERAEAYTSPEPRIAVSRVSADVWEIYSMLPNGEDPVALTSFGDVSNNASWSPDGSLVAFDRWNPSEHDSHIYTVSSTGDDPAQLTFGAVRDSNPSWSPSSQEMVFQRKTRSDNLFVLSMATGEVRPLTEGLGADVDPHWSPTGERIVFASHYANPTLDIFSIRPDGSDLTNLSGAPGSDVHPAWSPDGSQIAFASDRDGPRSDVFEIYVMSADGSNQRRLTFDIADDSGPTWSADGRIMFHSDRSGTYDLYTIRPDGSDLRSAVADPTVNLVYPQWQSSPVPSPTPSDHEDTQYVSDITIRLLRDPLRLRGDVRSDAAACASHRRVVVRKQHVGDDRTLGTVLTDAYGKWRFRLDGVRRGRLYAVARHFVGDGPTDCLRDRSRTVRL
jgi:TolB protein